MDIKEKKQANEIITVSGNDEVRLTVTIGDAQIGGSQVSFLNDPTIIKKGVLDKFLLGSGNDLRGKTLQVDTVVVDVNPATNKIAVEHNFINGNPDVFSLSNSVETDGDTFVWRTTYTFK